MARTFRLSLLLLLFCISAFAFSQGGAGGYGQGGGFGGGQGGGMGGGGALGGRAMNARDEAANSKKPDEEQVQNLWQIRTAVLTPGDRVEYKLKMRKGETLLAGVTSDAFDPALSVTDDKGTELFKNDDREEGDQSPFVVYRFAEAGSYTLKVLSFRSVSGGKFTLKLRTFVAMDAGLGSEMHEAAPLIDTDPPNRVAFRLQAKKGQILDLRQVAQNRNRYEYRGEFIRLIGPTGVEKNDFARIATGNPEPVFEALASGDYYAEYNATDGRTFTTDFREVTRIPVKDTSDETISLDPGELKIVEFPIHKDQIIRTTVKGPTVQQFLSAPANLDGGDRQQANGTNQSWSWYLVNVDSDNDVVRIFHEDAVARLALRSYGGQKQTVTFKSSESLPQWNDKESIKNTLNIGDRRFFLLTSTKSELMRVAADAAHFQPKLDIIRMNGEEANTLINRQSHTAGDDSYFPDPASFMVIMSCDGDGGSGEFEMKRETLKPVPYGLGTPTVLKLDGKNFGLYAVNLEAGKRYELITDQPGNPLRADLLDEDGQFLISQNVAFDKVTLQYFVPTRSGVHRLWLRGAPGERQFKFSLHVPPTIGK